MSGMQMIGPVPRAKQLSAAARRFRREVNYALGRLPGLQRPTRPHEVDETVGEIAETLAILRHVLKTVEAERGHADPGARTRLRNELTIWTDFYEVAR